jgi:hypothetical protein
MKWTEPKDLKAQVKRLWDRGLVLQSLLSEEATFPKRLVFKCPNSNDLAHAFIEVQAWCESLSDFKHVRFVYREVNNRVTGTNTLPAEAWIDKPEDAVVLLGMEADWRIFLSIVASTRQRQPSLLLWLARKPLVALQKAEEWERLLDMTDWMLAHPMPNCYLRQVDLPGIHTKFIELNKGLIAELLELLLPEKVIDSSATGVSGFCERYGFQEKPRRIRCRVLDPSVDPLNINGFPDLTLDVDSLAALSIRPKRVFITENEINFLAFPGVADAWILFGAGYGFGAWNKVEWLRQCQLYYWGDIDTHGFSVLDEFRHHFPAAQSFLMDRQTLMFHRDHWVTEPHPSTRSLSFLNEQEVMLYEDLQANRFGQQIRLEQERISFGFLTDFLSGITDI